MNPLVARKIRDFAPLAFLTVLCVALSLLQPEFLTRENLQDVLVQTSAVAIAGAGMTFVILTAGIDLSVGSVLAFAGCVGATAGVWSSGSQPDLLASAFGILALIFAGLLCGGCNAVLVNGLHLTPFIATLGMMSIARGMAYVVTDSQPVQVLDPMREAALARPFNIPFPIILMFGVYLLFYWLQRFTLLGRYVYAIGGNEQAALLSGIRVGRWKGIVYLLSGVCAALSGLVLAGRLGWMTPQQSEGFELDVIAAVVIGGTSLFGGSGSVWGTFLGAVIMGVVRNGLNLMGVDYKIQEIVKGAIILAAVAIDVWARRKTTRAAV